MATVRGVTCWSGRVRSPSRAESTDNHEITAAPTLGGQSQDRAVVVGAQQDLIGELRTPQPVFDGVDLTHVPVGQQRHAGQLARVDRPTVRPEGAVLSDHDDVGVLQQLLVPKGSAHHRQDDEGEVEVATLDEVQELLVVFRLRQLYAHLRPCRAKLADHAGQEPGAHALVAADSQRRTRVTPSGA